MTSKLSSSLEDYLEAVYALSRKDGFARASAVSRLLGVSKPSVSSAVKALSARGLLEQERYGYIRLTPSGLKSGAEISGRHSLLKDFLISVLGMDERSAERDACRAEHALSPEALDRFSALTVFLKAPGRSSILRAAKTAASGKARL